MADVVPETHEIEGFGGDEEEDDQGEDEELASSDDEEYNLTHFGISQALPVPDGPPDVDAGPPQTAEEYLQWVRYEASRCPRVTRKEIDPAVLARQEQRQQRQLQRQKANNTDDTNSSMADDAGVTRRPVVGGGGGGSGSASGGRRRRGTAFAAQVPPPVTSLCPEWARPSSKWLSAFLQDFFQLRRALSDMQRQRARELSATPLPSLDNMAAWDRLCFEQWQPLEQQQQQQSSKRMEIEEEDGGEGTATPPPPPPPPPPPAPPADGLTSAGGSGVGKKHGRELEEAAAGTNASVPAAAHSGDTDRLCGPVVRTVLSLDQVSVGCLIQRHVEQLGLQPCLSYIRSQWLFALAAVLERPVPPDVAAAMRDLVRRCSAWRASLEHPNDPVLPRLNVLLAVAGGYFGQDEQLSAAAAVAGLADLA